MSSKALSTETWSLVTWVTHNSEQYKHFHNNYFRNYVTCGVTSDEKYNNTFKRAVCVIL